MRGIPARSATNKALAQKLQAHGPACQLLARTIAHKIGVPYYEERVVERFLGHRLKGEPESALLDGPRYRFNGEVFTAWPTDPATTKPAEMHEVEPLTDEVWSRDHWPNTAETVPEAVARLPEGKLTGIYYHGPSMCLVLLHPGGVKLGIRAAAIIDPRHGADKTAIAAFNKLKKWVEPP